MCEVWNNISEREIAAYSQVYCEYGQAFCPEGSVNTE